MLFHEVSHASFLEQPLYGRLAAAFRSQQAEVPDGLGHVIQFITPAESLRQLLGDAERPTFEPYAERSGLYERNPVWGRYRAVLAETWAPSLGTTGNPVTALQQLAARLAPRPPAVGAYDRLPNGWPSLPRCRSVRSRIETCDATIGALVPLAWSRSPIHSGGAARTSTDQADFIDVPADHGIGTAVALRETVTDR